MQVPNNLPQGGKAAITVFHFNCPFQDLKKRENTSALVFYRLLAYRIT
jgi:hypothetical protein